jgi:hypothetical protein
MRARLAEVQAEHLSVGAMLDRLSHYNHNAKEQQNCQRSQHLAAPHTYSGRNSRSKLMPCGTGSTDRIST